MKIIILFSLALLISLTSMNCGAMFSSAPKMEVKEWNKKPQENTNIRNETFKKMIKISPDKFKVSYKYMYTGIGNINATMYKEAHSQDLLIMEFVDGEGVYKVTVFSNQFEPDPNFFR